MVHVKCVWTVGFKWAGVMFGCYTSSVCQTCRVINASVILHKGWQWWKRIYFMAWLEKHRVKCHLFTTTEIIVSSWSIFLQVFMAALRQSRFSQNSHKGRFCAVMMQHYRCCKRDYLLFSVSLWRCLCRCWWPHALWNAPTIRNQHRGGGRHFSWMTKAHAKNKLISLLTRDWSCLQSAACVV